MDSTNPQLARGIRERKSNNCFPLDPRITKAADTIGCKIILISHPLKRNTVLLFFFFLFFFFILCRSEGRISRRVCRVPTQGKGTVAVQAWPATVFRGTRGKAGAELLISDTRPHRVHCHPPNQHVRAQQKRVRAEGSSSKPEQTERGKRSSCCLCSGAPQRSDVLFEGDDCAL